MIQMEVEVCIVDDMPIESSPAYETLKREIGEELANKWTRTITVPADDA